MFSVIITITFALSNKTPTYSFHHRLSLTNTSLPQFYHFHCSLPQFYHFHCSFNTSYKDCTASTIWPDSSFTGLVTATLPYLSYMMTFKFYWRKTGFLAFFCWKNLKNLMLLVNIEQIVVRTSYFMLVALKSLPQRPSNHLMNLSQQWWGTSHLKSVTVKNHVAIEIP